MVSFSSLNTWPSTIPSSSLVSPCKPQTVTFDLLNTSSLTKNTSSSSGILKQTNSVVQSPTTSLNLSLPDEIGVDLKSLNNNNHEMKRKRGRPKLEPKMG